MMTQQEKITAIEQIFEVEPGSISGETVLETLQWDSMSMLSVIALANEHFHKRISGTQIKAFKTVNDIMEVLS
jgi:acyl carrier protein